MTGCLTRSCADCLHSQCSSQDLSRQMKNSLVKKDRSSAARIASLVQLPASLVSVAKLPLVRRTPRSSLPAGIPDRCGSSGLMRLAIASGSSRFSRPSNSTCREPFGPAKTVRTGTCQAAVRLFHDIEILFPVPIENRDTSFQRFQTGTRACSDNRGAEPIGKELAVLHGSFCGSAGACRSAGAGAPVIGIAMRICPAVQIRSLRVMRQVTG